MREQGAFEDLYVRTFFFRWAPTRRSRSKSGRQGQSASISVTSRTISDRVDTSFRFHETTGRKRLSLKQKIDSGYIRWKFGHFHGQLPHLATRHIVVADRFIRQSTTPKPSRNPVNTATRRLVVSFTFFWAQSEPSGHARSRRIRVKRLEKRNRAVFIHQLHKSPVWAGLFCFWHCSAKLKKRQVGTSKSDTSTHKLLHFFSTEHWGRPGFERA